jgi:hypothetical protein
MALQTKKKVLASFFLSDMKMCVCMSCKKYMIVIIIWYNYYYYFYQKAAYGIAVLAWMDVNA